MRLGLIIPTVFAVFIGLMPSCHFVSLPRLVACYMQNDRDPSDGFLEFVAECMTGTDLDHDGRAPHDPTPDHQCCFQGTVLFKENPGEILVSLPSNDLQHVALSDDETLGGFASGVWQPPQS